MTRAKAVSLLLAVVLMLTAIAAVAAMPIANTLASAVLPGSGSPFVAMMPEMPANSPAMACGGCSGGGSGGG